MSNKKWMIPTYYDENLHFVIFCTHAILMCNLR